MQYHLEELSADSRRLPGVRGREGDWPACFTLLCNVLVGVLYLYHCSIESDLCQVTPDDVQGRDDKARRAGRGITPTCIPVSVMLLLRLYNLTAVCSRHHKLLNMDTCGTGAMSVVWISLMPMPQTAPQATQADGSVVS